MLKLVIHKCKKVQINWTEFEVWSFWIASVNAGLSKDDKTNIKEVYKLNEVEVYELQGTINFGYLETKNDSKSNKTI